MKIYDALKKDHQTVEQLLNQLVQASESKNDNWKQIIDQISDELIPHARAEEAVFYNALRESEQTRGLIVHSYTEHAMAETELRTLQAAKTLDANWTSLAKKFRDDVLHHAKEEESKVFPAAQGVLSDDEAEKIGQAFEKMKPSIREQSFGGQTIDLIANLLPPRLVQSFRRHFSKQEKGAA